MNDTKKGVRYYSLLTTLQKEDVDSWKKEYKNWLLDKNVTYSEIQNRVKERCPKELIRFRRFSEFSKCEIEDETIYLQFLCNQNDPFEGNFFIDRERYCRETPAIILASLLSGGRGVDEEQWKLIVESCGDEFEKFKKKARIACFTQNSNDLLMWSHYADCHKGYCIHYDTTKIFQGIGECKLLPIVYSRRMCNATENLLSGGNWNISLNPILIKGKQWEYENEWRLISYEPNKEENDFDTFNAKGMVTRIDIGCECEKRHVEEMIEWCREKKIPVYRKKKAYNKFILEEERLL